MLLAPLWSGHVDESAMAVVASHASTRPADTNAPAPSGQNDPAGHGMQSDTADLPVKALYVPERQSFGDVDDAGQYVPAPHKAHALEVME